MHAIKKHPVIIFSFVIAILAFLALGYLLYLQKFSSRDETPPQLIEDFPESAVYPNTELKDTGKDLQEAGDFTYHGSWDTSDTVPEVMAWYLEILPQQGWFIDDYPAQDQADFIQFLDAHKEDDPSFILQLTAIREPGSDQTEILLEYPAKSTGEEDEDMEW
jgi:hypothetical protein